MEHTLLCLLLLLSTHIYSGHSEDDGQAKAVLTIRPKSSQIFSGESVTFRCNIQRGKVTDWEYTWRKDVVDLFSRKHKYEISEVNISNSGNYWCLGRHIDQKKDSKWSDAVTLTVTALPTASVKMVTTQETLYPRDTVKLQCDISNYTGWTYHWLMNKELLSSQTSKTSTISLSDQAGQYQCQGTRTKRPQNSYLSSSLHISVTALPETTLTVNPNPAYKGETVTLTCSVGSDSGWSYTWHKDNTKKVVTLSDRHTTTGATFTISRAAESDQGLYWCQGEIQSRSISSIISDPVTITVKGVNPGPSTSVLVGVVVGLVVAGVLLAILLVLLCRYKKAKDSCCNRIFSPPQPQSTNLDPQQDQGSTQSQAPDAGYTHLQHDGANIYDTITPSDNDDNDAGTATAGSSDVMYAQIQLKQLDKKKKKMTADPKENPVYSAVKTGKTTATGLVDVTYAEVNLKQKAKAKKKKETATPPEADLVYSQLKPCTAPGT
ncbi:Fc receptor-like protein 4 isoform X2 [Salmo salar]|uniref:Fc receptor-like protein 4 isoform X2 n=1 Tax=Salmo salar TaxID=8030 RepID=A0ABM3F353_SALSA|nr:Fc receptor-like protein 4 isoform X2 [Salmo salar]